MLSEQRSRNNRFLRKGLKYHVIRIILGREFTNFMCTINHGLILSPISGWSGWIFLKNFTYQSDIWINIKTLKCAKMYPFKF